MLNSLLKKLIKASAGRIRFVLAIAGLSVALLLIFSAVQLQANYYQLLRGKNNRDSIANFLVINKQITNSNRGNTALSKNEIDNLQKQSFADAVGILTPCHFKVSAQSFSNAIGFYSDIFFESVPDEFLDVKNDAWKWDASSDYIPMIVPNTFLDMYNFGFAASQNLPQLTQELVKNLPIQINIKTPLGQVSYTGKVVGFSDRISSVLVPQLFMDWANKKFGGENTAISRVVIKTKDPGAPALTAYLKQHGLSTDADKTRFSKYRTVVDYVVNISGITGLVMLLFALLIFTLFIQLTIASCKDEIQLLITLGAAPKQLQNFLMKQFFPSNIIITVIVLLMISLLQFLLQKFLQSQGIFVSPFISLFTVGAALLILLALWLANRITIRKYIYAMKY
jgi:hypothetical protein